MLNATNSQFEELYYAFPSFGSVVSQYDFAINENVFISCGIASHFLTGNIKPELLKEGSPVVTHSTSAAEDYSTKSQNKICTNYCRFYQARN